MTRAALVTAVIAACAAAAVAAAHGQPALLGWLAAISALAVATAAGAAAKDLRAPDDVTEPRSARGPSAPAPLPDDVLTRRDAVGGVWGLALAAVALLALVPFVALARRSPTRAGTGWFRGARLVTADGSPVLADALAVGGVATVFPEGLVGSPESATLLLRLQDDALRVRPGRAGWAPRGNVAYSKICTHAGCPVAIYRRESYQLYCPCHQSVFDVLDGAAPLSGPATRALPQLALEIDRDGYLIAQDDYTEPVGPDSWWRTT